MKKNLIKKLAEESYTKNTLDSGKILQVSKKLKREELKFYIKSLKNIESKRTVTVTLPSEEGASEIKAHLSKIYPNKRLVFGIDPTLLTGIRVVDFDNEYELSLKNFLEGSLSTTND
jgi:hypothetical protein